MSKKSVLKPAMLKAGGNRNAFPLGHTQVTQAPLGALIPVTYFNLPANSYFELDMENQTIMQPVVRPAFSILKEHFDVFAVPYCQLLQRFDNFTTGQSTYDNAAVQSAMLGGGTSGDYPQVPQSVPMFDGTTLAQCLYSMSQQTDVFGCNKAYNACRILDNLDYGNYYKIVPELVGSIAEANTDYYLANTYLPTNFFNLLAYQKIYYSHYANKKYETIDARYFNIDDLSNQVYSTTIADDVDTIHRFDAIMEMHYVQARKDYFNCIEPFILPLGSNINFTSLQVSAIQGNIWQVFGIPGTTNNTYNTLPSVQNASTGGNNTQSNGQQVQITSSSTLAAVSSGVSVASIRFAFAYDKLLRRMRSAGPSFNSQMLAQFGIKPIDQRHGDAIRLGGWTNQLRISEVTSLADSGSSDIGGLGGKMVSYSNNNKKIKYTAKEPCIIMVVYHTSIDPMYHSFNVSRDNLRKYRFDWFNPIFENMGLQPVFSAEYSTLANYIESDFYQADARADLDTQRAILGYNKRYMEYKSKVNKVHGLFQWPYDNELCSWVPTKHDQTFNSAGDFESYTPTPFVMSSFLQSPFNLNDVLSSRYNGTWETDPFLVFAYFNAKMIANMSVDGETF